MRRLILSFLCLVGCLAAQPPVAPVSPLPEWRAAGRSEALQVESGARGEDAPLPRVRLAMEPAAGRVACARAAERNFTFAGEIRLAPAAALEIGLRAGSDEAAARRFVLRFELERGQPGPAGGADEPGPAVTVAFPRPRGDGEETGAYPFLVRVMEGRLRLLVASRLRLDRALPSGWHGPLSLELRALGGRVGVEDPRLEVLPPVTATTSRGDLARARGGRGWWERMDYGPFHSSTVQLPDGDVVLKGITAHLDGLHRHLACFDTDLLRLAALGRGRLLLRGVSYDGSHGPQPSLVGTGFCRLQAGPGALAGPVPPPESTSPWRDPRPLRSGPLPREVGRYLGLYRRGDGSVFHYEVGGREVFERAFVASARPAGEQVRHGRTFEVGPSERLLRVAIADAPKGTLQLLGGEKPRTARLLPGAPPAKGSLLSEAMRSDLSFQDLPVGAPRSDDLAAGAVLRPVPGYAAPHAQAGAAADGGLHRATDGRWARDEDDTGRCVWADGAEARYHLDLGRAQLLGQVVTYSWHRAERAGQCYALWGHPQEKADPAVSEPGTAGWRYLGEVDSSELGAGGRHATAVRRVGEPLGRFRHLLWVCAPLERERGFFLTEIDVHPFEAPAPEPPAPLARRFDLAAHARWHFARETAPDGGDRLVLVVPPAPDFTGGIVAFGEEDPQAPPAHFDLGDMSLRPRAGEDYPELWGEALDLRAEAPSRRRRREEGPFAVEQIPIPFENPFASRMRIGAFDFFADGERAAVCTWNGDVWIVSGLGGEAIESVTWKRFATGLFETFGLLVVDDRVLVNGRDQITRLHDLDGDGEADHYECVDNQVYTTRNFHEFTFDLQRDPAGNLYVTKAAPVRGGGRGFDRIVPHHGTLMRVRPDGSGREVISTGMRAPNGLAVGPNGELSAGDNEGTWVPRCKLHWLRPGSFQGVKDTAHRQPAPEDYEPPLCWFPMEVDNSGGGQVWIPDAGWPWKGALLHLSYGKSSILRVLRQEVDGVMQGGVVKLPVRLSSSAMRGRFNPKDGQLYVSGLRGWQTNAAKLSGFQRIRYRGGPTRLPTALRATTAGLEITFDVALDPELAEDVESYEVEQWNYVWSPQYGSPEVSARSPDPEVLERARKQEMHRYRKRDRLPVRRARLLADGRTVCLEIPEIGPVMQMRVGYDLESAEGEEVRGEIHHTIHRLGEPRDDG